MAKQENQTPSSKKPSDQRSSSELDEKPRPPAGEGPDIGGKFMANISKSDYTASIEQSVSVISVELDSSVVKSVFRKYGAHDIEDLNSIYLPDVFSELYTIEADLR